jgi:hypothetical protein
VRASELLGAELLDADGSVVGTVRDVLVETDSDVGAPGPDGYRVAGLVVGPQAWAHRCGLAGGQTGGPALLRWLAGPARRSARFVPAAAVAEWAPRPQLAPGAATRPLTEVLP